MKAQTQEFAHQVGTPAIATKAAEAPKTVLQAAEAFLAMRREAERVEAELAKLKKYLGTELKALPGQQVAVGGEIVYLCDTESKSLDWESAKESLKPSALKAFEPFVKHIEKFELAAAEKVTDLSPLKAFIETKKSTQVRVKANKETA